MFFLYNISSSNISKVQLITEENRLTIGKESHEKGLPQKTEIKEYDQDIPENNILHSIADDFVYPGTSISEIQFNAGGDTPEVIVPNGAIGILVNQDSQGWNCIEENKILWSFSKYPLDNNKAQPIAIGYIKDGVMYEPQIFQSELDVNYSYAVKESGLYYLYFMGASSDPISIKKGVVQLIF